MNPLPGVRQTSRQIQRIWSASGCERLGGASQYVQVASFCITLKCVQQWFMNVYEEFLHALACVKFEPEWLLTKLTNFICI